MNYLAKVFINNSWLVKLITIVLLTLFLSGLAYVISAISLFLSTVLNLPGLVVLAFLASVSLILLSVVKTVKEEK
ncbi:putative membrane protein [Staphylococcus phage Stab22]|nr:putative membrane protein [Staphylococcus phage Stab22]